MKAEMRRIVGLLPLMLLSMTILSLLVRGSGVLAYPSFQSPPSPISPPPSTVTPSPTTVLPSTETSTPTPTESPAPAETPTPTPTETLAPGETPAPTETPLPSSTPMFEASPPAVMASPSPSAEETASESPHATRSWADYVEIGLVALAYTWRGLGVLALIAFLGLVIFLAIGRWRS